MAAAYPTADPSFSTKVDGPTEVIQAAHMNAVQDEIIAIGSALRGTCSHDLKLAAAKHVYEDGAAFYLGQRNAVTFDAGHFTASGSMTWTVEAADVGTFSWTKVGDFLTVCWGINTSTVAGTPDKELRITIPNSETAEIGVYGTFYLIDDGTRGAGYCEVAANGTSIILKKEDYSNWSASTNLTGVYGQLSFWVK